MLAQFIVAWVRGLPSFAWTTGAFIAIEVLLPRSRPSLESRIRGVFIALMIITPASILFGMTLAVWAPWTHSLVPASLWKRHPALTVAGTFVVWDFCFYVMHRIQHKYLWRLHSIHHSFENIGAINNYNHPIQIFFDWLFIYLPVGLLGLSPAGIVGSIISLQGLYIHSSMRLNVGPLRWLLIDNQYHRIHHSREPQHWDKNFALFFPFWDWVFGTMYRPAADEWPQTGVTDVPEERSIMGYLAQPFRPKTARLIHRIDVDQRARDEISRHR